jgi:AraC-like DNA-binding protein
VQRARQFIDANCCEDISIENLAAIAHLSPYHFIRTFHKEMGLPPHRYLKQARAKNARELISSGRSITEAALESGFVDQSHLSRNFKSIFGFTPGQYSSFVQDGRSTMI